MFSRYGAALALAAASLAGSPVAAVAPHHEALVPARREQRTVKKRLPKNAKPTSRYRNPRGSKLGRRLKRKHALGMMGAF